MAAQAIQFTISTVDKATRTINRINDSVSRMTRPYQNLARSVQRFSKASGLTEVGKRLDAVAQKAGKAAASVTRIGAPLLALVGGGTLAGLTDLVVQWERMGAETERTARLLGITAGELTQMRSAATLMGVSADTMTSGFRGFADTLQDARWGRNQAAFATIQALGITLHTTKNGATDTQAALYDLADRIQRIQHADPAAARNLARSLGVEQLLPVLVRGRRGMQAYEAEARRLRGDFTPQMAARAQAFALSLDRMRTAADGLKASIADSLAPVFGPMIDRFTEWIARNRELIAQRIVELAQRLARWLASVDWGRFAQGVTDAVTGLIGFASWIGRVVDAIGGWKVAAVAIAAYMVGGFALSVVSTIASIGMLIARLVLLRRSYVAAGAAARGAGGLLRFVNPATVGAYLGLHSENLNKGEDEQLRRIRTAEAATGGVWPGSANAPPAQTAPGATPATGTPLNPAVAQWAQKLNFAGTEARYGLPAGLLSAIAQKESRGNPMAVSPAGARGLFQFMPATAREYGIDAFNPAQAADAAARKMSGLLARYKGNLTYALSAYNWGEGNLDRKGLANAPAETRDYAPGILAHMPSLDPGMDVASLNAPGAAATMQNAPAPVVHVDNHVHVARDGSVTVKTRTPAGLKIARPMEALG
ncbi:transglycosylase SLT domain-containing protein [Paraburkholderia sp. 35.1]|uniref:transglycosylase SLT domain-containing protein n=1 Tax=Paraburkholderia sp. 35.1 TaxID=2991058 RepID=UPI003D1AA4D4